MGFLEKLKNTFFEEEIVEVEEPQRKVKVEKGPKEKKVKKENIEETNSEEEKEVSKEKNFRNTNVQKEEIEDLLDDDFDDDKEVFTEKVLTRGDKNFRYFEDEDFVDNVEPVKQVKEEKKQPYAGAKLYNNPQYTIKQDANRQPYSQPYSKDQKTGFKPTPIISPIYGILDQNYKKEEIVDKKEIRPNSSYVSRKNADLDSVRNKAFGELTQDLGLTSQEPIVIEEEKEESTLEDNLLYDMNDFDTTPTVDKVTIADAEEYFQDLGLEYNIDYKDVKYERANGRRVRTSPVIDDIDDDLPIAKEKPKKKEPVDEEKLEDNLFDLIDSMYNEKE